VIDLISSSDDEAEREESVSLSLQDEDAQAEGLNDDLELELYRELLREEAGEEIAPSASTPNNSPLVLVLDDKENNNLQVSQHEQDPDLEPDEQEDEEGVGEEEEQISNSPTATPCPTGCRGFLTMRRRKRDDSPFWACTNYATTGCQYTEAYVEPLRQQGLVPGNRSAFTFHSRRKVTLKGGRTVHYKDCSEKKRKNCPAKVRVDVDTGEWLVWPFFSPSPSATGEEVLLNEHNHSPKKRRVSVELSPEQQALVDEVLRRLPPFHARLELQRRNAANSTIFVPSYNYLRNRKRYIAAEGNADLDVLLQNPAVYDLLLKRRGRDGVQVLLLIPENVRSIVRANPHAVIFIDGTW
jgi:hypothetical protein